MNAEEWAKIVVSDDDAGFHNSEKADVDMARALLVGIEALETIISRGKRQDIYAASDCAREALAKIRGESK